jgi:hypothetical protein
MLLAASRRVVGEGGESVKEAVEVLDAGDAAPGTRIGLEGREPLPVASPLAMPEIDADAFFSVPIAAKNGCALVGDRRLLAAGRPFTLLRVSEGEVG